MRKNAKNEHILSFIVENVTVGLSNCQHISVENHNDIYIHYFMKTIHKTRKTLSTFAFNVWRVLSTHIISLAYTVHFPKLNQFGYVLSKYILVYGMLLHLK